MLLEKIKYSLYLHLLRGRYSIPKCILDYIKTKYSYFRFVNECEIIPVKHKYKTKTSPTNVQKSLVLIFDDTILNTGLADRLRAIASMYYWAIESGLSFKVFFNKPFVLEQYLVPNNYDWLISEEEIDYANSVPKALISISNEIGEQRNLDYQKRYLESLKKLNYNQIHLYTNSFCYDEQFHQSYHELFKPSNYLIKCLDSLKVYTGEPYITVSFRFTQLLGDLKDSFGSPLPAKEKNRLMEVCKSSIYDILAENTSVRKVIVTSDSITFLDYIKNLLNIIILPGRVGHISTNSDTEAVDKTFCDMYVIANARKAYMVRTKVMYKSGFAKRAALIGGIPFEEHLIED